MLTAPDFRMKQIVILLAKHGEKLSFKNDNLIVTDSQGDIRHQSTCYRLFALFVVGNFTITSGLIDRLEKFGFSLVLMSQNLRVIGVWSSRTEGNVLLRRKQYQYDGLEIAQRIVSNKIGCQIENLRAVREKSDSQKFTIENLSQYKARLPNEAYSLKEILGLEGIASREYFRSIFQDCNWTSRQPRVKHDPINCILDIGYTMLFNIIEGLLNIYGFDLYNGVYHRQFYQRRSLVCDLVEPFRPIVDFRIRKAFNLGQIRNEDFQVIQNQYRLFGDTAKPYLSWLLESIMEEREEMFLYVQHYYRAFMRDRPIEEYPYFTIQR